MPLTLSFVRPILYSCLAAAVSFTCINGSINHVFAFDGRPTHAILTDLIIDKYNEANPEHPFSGEEKKWVSEGSAEEDTAPRFINHFYDPINGAGWSGDNTGIFSSSTVAALARLFASSAKPVSSIDWLHNQALQSAYQYFGGNQTWEKGLHSFYAGEREEAFRTLGHALHLLEDLAVPEHARDDTHINSLAFLMSGAGSPYEKYAGAWTNESIKTTILNTGLNKTESIVSADGIPPETQSPDDYFRALSGYANKYFYSEETVSGSKYAAPNIIRDNGELAYGKDESGKEMPIANVEFAFKNGTLEKNYLLVSNQDFVPIFNAYASHIVPRIIAYGARVTELFLKKGAEEDAGNVFSGNVPKITSVLGFLLNPKDTIAGIAGSVGDSLHSLFGSIAGIIGISNESNYGE
ncbi:MAG: hypothetical protein V1489_01960, partial [Candidatus Liptonbacteria bacterium]